jgi:hypothetical protein
MTQRIYLTHCSAKKDMALQNTGKKVTPNRLYTAKPTQRFMHRCIESGVRWAIFSDHYGVWFPEIEREWYGDDVGNPNRVTESRFLRLVENFDDSLKGFDEIFFYFNPGRFHPLYTKLLDKSALKGKIRLMSHLSEIG